jgi:sulfur relay (sulfurtransferase) DsrC/TusE family protein
MQLISTLEDLIEDEISDVKKYAKMAVELKKTNPSLAQVLYNISTQEEGHQAALHGEVVKMIEAYRKEHGAPPAAMMAVYDYVHKKHIDKMAEARRYQEMYKN